MCIPVCILSLAKLLGFDMREQMAGALQDREGPFSFGHMLELFEFIEAMPPLFKRMGDAPANGHLDWAKADGAASLLRVGQHCIGLLVRGESVLIVDPMRTHAWVAPAVEVWAAVGILAGAVVFGIVIGDGGTSMVTRAPEHGLLAGTSLEPFSDSVQEGRKLVTCNLTHCLLCGCSLCSPKKGAIPAKVVTANGMCEVVHQVKLCPGRYCRTRHASNYTRQDGDAINFVTKVNEFPDVIMVNTHAGFSVNYLRQLYMRSFRCATKFTAEGMPMRISALWLGMTICLTGTGGGWWCRHSST